MRRALLLAAALAAGGAQAAPADDARTASANDELRHLAAGMAAHQATYDLSLAQSRGDVVGAGGRMEYEVLDACDGWATRQRLQLNLENRDTHPIQMVSDYTTFEAKDGRRLSFQMRQTTETALTLHVAGEATLDRPGGEGEVRYTDPPGKVLKLPPGTEFPTWHTARIVQAAIRGEKFLSLPLFDGTGADGAQDSSVVITGWGHVPSPYPALAELPSGKVHVAFFPRGKEAAQPDYEIGMRYWRDGVSDDLRMDFGNFVMNGMMKSFKVVKPRC